jgi:hypothetical protein
MAEEAAECGKMPAGWIDPAFRARDSGSWWRSKNRFPNYNVTDESRLSIGVGRES